jgi:hypothetical protein
VRFPVDGCAERLLWSARHQAEIGLTTPGTRRQAPEIIDNIVGTKTRSTPTVA